MFSGPFGFPGIFFFLEIVGSALVIALVVGIVVFLVRSDAADVRGRRPYAVYLFVVMFASLLTLLGAAGALAETLGVAITHTRGGGGQSCTFSATAEPLQAVPEGQDPDRVAPIPRQFPAQQEECVSFGASGQGAPAARAGIVAAVAAGILAFHVTQARRLIAKEVSGA